MDFFRTIGMLICTKNGQKKGRVLKKKKKKSQDESGVKFPGFIHHNGLWQWKEEFLLKQVWMSLGEGGVGAATSAGFDNRFIFSKETTETWNSWGWKRPWSPIITPAPASCSPLNHDLNPCGFWTFPWMGLHLFPGQPIPALDNPFHGEISPNSQSKPSLAQLKAISSNVQHQPWSQTWNPLLPPIPSPFRSFSVEDSTQGEREKQGFGSSKFKITEEPLMSQPHRPLQHLLPRSFPVLINYCEIQPWEMKIIHPHCNKWLKRQSIK